MLADTDAQAFIARWRHAGGSERANYQLFVTELCALLGVPAAAPGAGRSARQRLRVRAAHHLRATATAAPAPASSTATAAAPSCWKPRSWSQGRRPHPRGFDDALLRARAQAESYARALPAAEGRPPFLVVVDVGHVIELYAEFTRSGATYTPFPDPRSHRIRLDELARRRRSAQRLRALWLDPLALDPTRASAKVTRAGGRASWPQLARSLEAAGHPAQTVAAFLTRCLFSMFAEDVGLLPKDAERPAAASSTCSSATATQPATLRRCSRVLWADMDRGGFSAALAAGRAALQRQAVQGLAGRRLRAAAAPRRRSTACCAAASRQLARGGARHLRHAAGTRARPDRAPRAGRALHAARLRRAAGAAHRGGAAARRLGRRAGRRAGAGQRGRRAGRQEARRQAGRGARRDPPLPPPAVHHARARPGLRQRQLPVRDAGTPEAAGRRGAERSCDALGETQGRLGLEGETVTLQQLRGIETQRARRRAGRAGAVDRLAAVAHPQLRQRQRGRAGDPRLRQHRTPRRGAGLGRPEPMRDAKRRAGHALGRQDASRRTRSPASRCPTRPRRCRSGAT